MADAGDLEKLPQELRNEIYEMALVNLDGVPLQYYQAKGASHYMIDGKPIIQAASHQAALIGHHRNAKHRSQKWRGSRWYEIPSKTALAQVNKQVHAETTPILYGMTRFEFGSTKALQWFLEQIGDKRLHLRTLILQLSELDDYALPAGRRAIKVLLASKNIRTLGSGDFFTSTATTRAIILSTPGNLQECALHS